MVGSIAETTKSKGKQEQMSMANHVCKYSCVGIGGV